MFEKDLSLNLRHSDSKRIHPRIFDFSDYTDFLNAYVSAYGKYSQGPYNLKNWANRLGYKSPSSLAMVLSKQRIPTVKMIISFAEDFNFTKSEKKYFEILVEIEKLKKRKKDFSQLLEEAKIMSGLSEYQKISYEQFSVVSDWHCYVIKALIGNKNFVFDIDWIFETLRKKVTRSQIKNAIENLKKVGFIEDDPIRGLRENPRKTHTGNNIPSSAIKNHHRGMLVQASQALSEQTIDNRFFQGLTINLKKKEDLSSAMKDIKNFIDEFNEKYKDDKKGDSVYQLNLQLFEHTKNLEN